MGIPSDWKTFPRSPGVYIMGDGRGKVLYVGKAKDLRARVRNYSVPGGDGRPAIPNLVARVGRSGASSPQRRRRPSSSRTPSSSGTVPSSTSFSATTRSIFSCGSTGTRRSRAPSWSAGQRATGRRISARTPRRGGSGKPCGNCSASSRCAPARGGSSPPARGRASTSRWEGASARAPARSRGSGISLSSTTRCDSSGGSTGDSLPAGKPR